MLTMVKTESRQITKSVKVLRDLLKFVNDLEDYELISNDVVPRVLGYSIPYTKLDPSALRRFFENKSEFVLSHSGQYSLLQYRYDAYLITITFRGKHSNLAIKENYERVR